MPLKSNKTDSNNERLILDGELFRGDVLTLKNRNCIGFQSSFKKSRTFVCINKIGVHDSLKTINCSECANYVIADNIYPPCILLFSVIL